MAAKLPTLYYRVMLSDLFQSGIFSCTVNHDCESWQSRSAENCLRTRQQPTTKGGGAASN